MSEITIDDLGKIVEYPLASTFEGPQSKRLSLVVDIQANYVAYKVYCQSLEIKTIPDIETAIKIYNTL